MEHINSTQDPKHAPFDFSRGFNHCHLCLVMIFILLVIAIIEKYLYQDLAHGNDVTENLGPYWKNIRGKDQMAWYCSEVYQRERLNVKTIDDQALEKLRTSKRRNKYFDGACNYSTLANLEYCDTF